MPAYQYTCRKCGKNFEIAMLMSEHAKKKVRCTKCGSLKVTQRIASFFAQTSKKS